MIDAANPQKAYRVYEKYESGDHAQILVFAANASEARQIGWEYRDELRVEEYTDLRTRREPWADQYAATERIPLRVYLEHGWEWECWDCGRRVGLYNIGGMTEDDQPLCVWCATQKGMSPSTWTLEQRTNER